MLSFETFYVYESVMWSTMIVHCACACRQDATERRHEKELGWNQLGFQEPEKVICNECESNEKDSCAR